MVVLPLDGAAAGPLKPGRRGGGRWLMGSGWLANGTLWCWAPPSLTCIAPLTRCQAGWGDNTVYIVLLDGAMLP